MRHIKEREEIERADREQRRKKRARVFAFLPPTLHVVDDWLSRGLAIGDTIISLVNGLGGTPKEP
jgi:hypothetical protein